MGRSTAIGAWKTRAAAQGAETRYFTPGSQEIPPIPPEHQRPSEHERTVDSYINAVAAPTRSLHRPMSASIRPKTRGRDANNATPDGLRLAKQPGFSHSARSIPFQYSSAAAAQVYTRSGLVPGKTKAKAKVRTSSAQSAEPAAASDTAAAETVEGDRDQLEQEATQGEADADANDFESFSPSDSHELMDSRAGAIKSWTGVFPASGRPVSSPMKGVHHSGTRFFTSTQAFEDWIMTRESKWKRQQVKRAQDMRRDRVKAQSRKASKDSLILSMSECRQSSAATKNFAGPVPGLSGSLFAKRPQTGPSTSGLSGQRHLNKDSLPGGGRSGIQRPSTGPGKNNPECTKNVARVIEFQDNARIRGEKSRRLRAELEEADKRARLEEKRKLSEDAQKLTREQEKRAAAAKESEQYLRSVEEERAARVSRSNVIDDGGVNSVYYFDQTTQEMILSSHQDVKANPSSVDTTEHGHIEKYQYLERAEHSRSLAASLGFKTRVL